MNLIRIGNTIVNLDRVTTISFTPGATYFVHGTTQAYQEPELSFFFSERPVVKFSGPDAETAWTLILQRQRVTATVESPQPEET